MNKKKVVIGISIFILLIVVFGILYFIVFKKSYNGEARLNINDVVVIDDTDITVGEDYYIKEDEIGFTIFNFKGEVLYKCEDKTQYFEIFSNSYIIVKGDNTVFVIDKNGNKLVNGSTIVSVYSGNTSDYIIIDNNVYDKNMKLVYTLEDYFSEMYVNNKLFVCMVVNNKLILTFEDKAYNVIIDLNTKEKVFSGFDDYIPINNLDGSVLFIMIKYNDKYDIFDTKKNEVVINDATVDEGYNIIKDNKSMYIYNNKIYKDNTKIGTKYYMSSDGCSVGGKLFDNKGNVVIDKCMFYYDDSFDDVIIGSNFDKSVVYLNNKIIDVDTATVEGDYIITSTTEGVGIKYKVYNKKGKEEKIDNEITYLGNGIYQMYDNITRSVSFLDNKLNKISIDVNNILCSFNDYCSVSDDNYNKMLYRNGKIVTSNIYDDIDINSDYITARTVFNTYIYKLGNKDEINIDTDEDILINVDDIIAKYELNDIESKIKANELLFKKYAYLIEENNNLLEYKKQVMDMFEVVVDNKKYLNDNGLLRKLKQLNIVYADDLGFGVGATYSDGDVRISLKEKDNNTLYHELMHFIDFSFNNNNNLYNIYNCNGKYVVQKGFDSNCEAVYIDSNFITEAGAEVYSGKYYTHELESYTPAPLILEALEYICGSDEVNDWFFNSDAYFKKLWLDIGYSYEEAEKVINALSNRTKIESNGEDDTIFIVDAVIDLYKFKKSSDFMSDNIFKYIIRNILDYRRNFTNSKYANELDVIVSSNDSIINVLNNSIGNYVLYKDFGDFIIIDGKEYISSLCYKNDEIGALLIDYDFDNNKVLDYSYKTR